MARPKGRTVKRADVVEAGMALLDSQGPDAVSLSNVALRLGLRTPSLYNHVKSSLDLQQAIVMEILERAGQGVMAGLEGEITGRDAEGFLRTWAVRWRRYALAHAHHLHYLMAAPLDWSETPFAPTWTMTMERFGAAMVGMGLRGDEVLHASRHYISTVQGFVRVELRGDRLPSAQAEESFAWTVERILDSVRPRGARPDASQGISAA